MNLEMPGTEQAVFALTSGGAALAAELAATTGARLFLPARLGNSQSTVFPSGTVFFENFAREVEKAFSAYRELVFIMATGIVVRTIAPLLKSKYRDPAVVVMDEKGLHAISLVSGHVGGANRLARQVAGITGASPVITTATDAAEKPAVDVLAEQLNCVPVPQSLVKNINRALAEGEPVQLSSLWPLPERVRRGFEDPGPQDGEKYRVIITRQAGRTGGNTLYLLPRNLVAGVGCRRGTAGEDVAGALQEVLNMVEGGAKRLKALATVDIKQDEPGIYHAAEKFNVPVNFFSRAELAELQGGYEESAFVKKTLGVGGVCEPAAILAANRGKVLVPKRKAGPVAAAVAEERLWWWDWAPETGNA